MYWATTRAIPPAPESAARPQGGPTHARSHAGAGASEIQAQPASAPASLSHCGACAGAACRRGPGRVWLCQCRRAGAAARAKTYEPGSAKLPTAIAHLTYDQYQSIRFRRADALWRNQSLYEVQFFHRGFNFDRRVAISEVVDGAAAG